MLKLVKRLKVNGTVNICPEIQSFTRNQELCKYLSILKRLPFLGFLCCSFLKVFFCGFPVNCIFYSGPRLSAHGEHPVLSRRRQEVRSP